MPPTILQQLELSPTNNIFWLTDSRLSKLPLENAKRRTMVFTPATRTAFLQLKKTFVEKHDQATHIMFDIASRGVINYTFVRLE